MGILSIASVLLFVFLLFTDTANSQSHGDLRLAQQDERNTSFTAGRLEIYIDSTWGTICTDNFDMVDAHVACRQLGFSRASHTETSFHTPYGRGKEGPVWLDEVGCDSNSLHLLSCPHVEIEDIDCDHFSDVAVECIEHSSGLDQPGDLEVRLQGEGFRSQGILEVSCNNTWAQYCHATENGTFGKSEGDVICKQLGYTEAVKVEMKAASSSSLQFWSQDLECPTDAWSIAACGAVCRQEDDLPEPCTSRVFIECTHSIRYGSLRLVQGEQVIPGASAGRLEVFYNGNWSNVCFDDFNFTEANVSCKELGFLRAVDYDISVDAGFESGGEEATILSGFKCGSQDRSLIRCRSHETEQNCTHLQDVALFCTDVPIPNIQQTTTEGITVPPGPVLPLEIVIIIVVGGILILLLCCVCLAVYVLYFSLVPYDTKKEHSAHGLYFKEYEGSCLTLDVPSLDQKLADLSSTATTHTTTFNGGELDFIKLDLAKESALFDERYVDIKPRLSTSSSPGSPQQVYVGNLFSPTFSPNSPARRSSILSEQHVQSPSVVPQPIPGGEQFNETQNQPLKMLSPKGIRKMGQKQEGRNSEGSIPDIHPNLADDVPDDDQADTSRHNSTHRVSFKLEN